jgi:hypothetical protein
MRKTVCLSAGAAAILLAAAAPAAQRSGLAAAGGGARVFHRDSHFAGPRAGTGGLCARSVRRACFPQRRHERGLGTGWIGYGYGGLTEDPESLRDQGFFADTGDAWAANGHAVYDYDRSYPYDWYPAAPAALDGGSGDGGPGPAPAPTVRCEIAWVADARGARSPVRVCRGRR